MERDKALSTTWDALWERTRLMFTEEDVETYEKRKAVAAKKLKRAGLAQPPIDLDKVKVALIEYATTFRYVESVENSGISRFDMVSAFDLWPESKMVAEFIGRLRDEEYEREKPEIKAKCRKQLEKLATDDDGKCKASVKAVVFGLERMDKANFGDPRVAAEETRTKGQGGGGGGILVNINAEAAKVCAAPPDPAKIGGKAQVFIDV